MPTVIVTQTSERRERQERTDLIAALRMFVADHEASGHFCEGLDAAWLRAKALLMQIEGGR